MQQRNKPGEPAQPNPDNIVKDADHRMKGALEAFKREMVGIRTGRAHPSLVEHLQVDYHGTVMPLNQIAGVTSPDARTIAIQPWDPGAIPLIEKAILKSDLGLNPSNDGHMVRIMVPPLTEERRRDLVKVVAKKTEDARIAARNVRRDALDTLKNLEKNKALSQDQLRRYQDTLQKLTDKSIGEIEQAASTKQNEIMQV